MHERVSLRPTKYNEWVDTFQLKRLFSEQLESKFESFGRQPGSYARDIGSVLTLGDGIARIYGLES